MKRFLSFICIVLLLSGCSVQTDPLGTIPPAAPELTEAPIFEEPTEDTPLIAVSVPATTQYHTLQDGTEIFSYTHQHMNLIHPNAEVANRVILEFLNRVDTTQKEAQQILENAKINSADTDDWYPYYYKILYNPTRIDQGILSLFGTHSSYAGGIHSSVSCIGANYDLQTGDILTLGSIMHKDATVDDFVAIIVEKLAVLAEDLYLFEDYSIGVHERFRKDENLFQDFFFTATGLSFFFSPYEIAPYASGIITVEIPYEELPGLIYDGYFPPERDQIEGTLQTGAFSQLNMTSFTNMAEVNLSSEGEKIVVYPSGNVENIEIIFHGDGRNISSYTVFAAYQMSEQDAVIVKLKEEDLDKVSINYYANNLNTTIPLSH